MPGPPPPIAAVRSAVRRVLAGLATAESASAATELVLVACSGGADSLALAAGVAFEAPKLGLRAGAVVVDHGLQEGSAAVAEVAAEQCRSLGLDPVVVRRASVGEGAGPEDAARQARYAALDAVAAELGAAAVLLGHTRDDQAEQVLLGLARGSGTRSLAGMPSRRGHYVRPLLGVSRDQTEATCTAYGLGVWRDPHNADRRFTRVRARRGLAALEAELGPGVAEALARSAEVAGEDADALDALALAAVDGVDPPAVPVAHLAGQPPAVRRRMWLLLAQRAGARALTRAHVLSLDALVTDWRGQGPVDLPGLVRAERVAGGLVRIAAQGLVAR